MESLVFGKYQKYMMIVIQQNHIMLLGKDIGSQHQKSITGVVNASAKKMKPYGFFAVGPFSWFTNGKPGKPHTVTTANDAAINLAADRRRPKRAERQRAKKEILDQLNLVNFVI